MKFTWCDETFEMVQQSDLTWIEMEALEEATGFTSTEIQEDKRIAGKARVAAAFFWLSVRRQNEKVEFAEFFGSNLNRFEIQDEGEEETAPPPPVIADDPLDEAAGSTSSDSAAST